MLDIHTLDKEISWLYARHDQQHSQEGKDIIRSLLDEVIERRNNISKKIQEEGAFGKLILSCQKGNVTTYICQTCGGKHNIIKTYFTIRYVEILRKTFEYCVENKTHVILVKDIKTFTHSEYCNFATLQRFGFIYAIKDSKRGEWGVAVKRIYAFLRGEWKCAEYSLRNVLTKVRVVSDTRVSIYDIYEQEKCESEASMEEDDIHSLPHYIEYMNIESLFPENCDKIGE